MTSPIVKWVGGKTSLVPELLARVPVGFCGSYFEPFAGGAALFFALAARMSHDPLDQDVVGDSNLHLIECYRTVAWSPDSVATAVRRLDEDRVRDPVGHYAAVRSAWNEWRTNDNVERAAAFLYLNRCGYNGLWRVNSRGEFNVPRGRYKDPLASLPTAIERASSSLRLGDFRHGDYRTTCEGAQAGDLVYFDPPYLPVKGGSFTAYSESWFGEPEHRQLARFARDLHGCGVHVIVSNSDVPLVRELYSWAQVDVVSARRNVNSKGRERGPVTEVIVSAHARRTT